MKFGSSFTDTFKKQVRFILSGFIQRGDSFFPRTQCRWWRCWWWQPQLWNV